MTAPETRILDTAFEVELAAECADTGVVWVNGIASAVVRRPDGTRVVFTHVPRQREAS